MNNPSYSILHHTDKFKLEIEVIEYMEEGWEPLGGVVIAHDYNCIRFYQTMVRK